MWWVFVNSIHVYCGIPWSCDLFKIQFECRKGEQSKPNEGDIFCQSRKSYQMGASGEWRGWNRNFFLLQPHCYARYSCNAKSLETRKKYLRIYVRSASVKSSNLILEKFSGYFTTKILVLGFSFVFSPRTWY